MNIFSKNFSILLFMFLILFNTNAFGGSSFLHLAAKSGDLNRVIKLCKDGADINALDGFNRTPLEWAALEGEEKVVVELLKHAQIQVNKWLINDLRWKIRINEDLIADFGFRIDAYQCRESNNILLRIIEILQNYFIEHKSYD